MARQKGDLISAYKRIFVMASLLIIAVVVSLVYIYIVGARGIYTAQRTQIMVEFNKVKSELQALTATFSPPVGQASALAELQKIQGQLEQLIEKAEKLKPPSEFKDSHQALKTSLNNYRTIVGKLIRSFELSDTSLFSEAKNELDKASRTNLMVPTPSFNTASVAADLNNVKVEVRRVVESYEPGSSESQQAIADLQASKDEVDQLLEGAKSSSSTRSNDPTISRLISSLEQYQLIIEKLITSYENSDTALFAQTLDELEKAEQTIIESP
jgi:exonuclease VII small subunit